MPTVTQEHIEGYAHCPDSLCEGNEQERVPAIRETVSTTYFEIGGDMPGVQNSTSRCQAADENGLPSTSPCPHCGTAREISDQERPTYPILVSQFNATSTDQRLLLKLKKQGLIQGVNDAKDESAELSELRRELAELRGFMQGQQSTRRKPKLDEAA